MIFKYVKNQMRFYSDFYSLAKSISTAGHSGVNGIGLTLLLYAIYLNT